MHRFFVSPEVLAAPEVVLPRDVAQQVTRVLRLRAGERVALFCGDGWEWTAVLREVSGGRVAAQMEERTAPDVEPVRRLDVGLAVLKGEKLDWTVQKLTELGVCRIVLLQTERTVVTAGEERWGKRLERYRRIAQEAAEQCGAVRLPVVTGPRRVGDLLSRAEERWYFLDPRAAHSLVEETQQHRGAVGLLVGPEGGFTRHELEEAEALGAAAVRLGRRILRAETAAIAAAALVASGEW